MNEIAKDIKVSRANAAHYRYIPDILDAIYEASNMKGTTTMMTMRMITTMVMVKKTNRNTKTNEDTDI